MIRKALLPLVLALGAGACGGEGARDKKQDEAVPVLLATAELRDVPRELATFGTVEASSTVDVAAQVQGLVNEVHFKEGDFVKRGDLLFTVDTRPYRASLAAAQAELARTKALADQASLEAERAARLHDEGVASEREVAQAQADAASKAANVKLNQAQIQSASLNVAFTRISSPIDGRTGSVLVHAGNVVHPGDTQPLVVIRSLKPVQVRFSVPQENLGAIRERLGKEPIAVSARPRGSEVKAVQGLLTFLESTVDAATGTVALKATFSNDDLALWPGSAVDVVLTLGTDRQALVVPEAALQRGQAGTTVFALGKDGRAELRPVEVLRIAGTQALLRSGVNAGEEVVTDGQLRLRRGSKLSRKPPSKATASAAPDEKRPVRP
ncbi:MAG TPA: efflux RND transporter periplasmic adaptor subunit [Polyangiaceae bacterium]|nr:efflux RND transporter periplasmic adaptor subunit [Polyangiaceae bacterium]